MVSEKTVRDIWTGRTWSRETWHLDTSRNLQLKQLGRPKGCRDSQPRKQRGSGLPLSRSCPSRCWTEMSSSAFDHRRHTSDTNHLLKPRCCQIRYASDADHSQIQRCCQWCQYIVPDSLLIISFCTRVTQGPPRGGGLRTLGC